MCSEDGSRHWVLRLSDGRLCDETGAALTETLPEGEAFSRGDDQWAEDSDESEMEDERTPGARTTRKESGAKHEDVDLDQDQAANGDRISSLSKQANPHRDPNAKDFEPALGLDEDQP